MAEMMLEYINIPDPWWTTMHGEIIELNTLRTNSDFDIFSFFLNHPNMAKMMIYKMKKLPVSKMPNRIPRISSCSIVNSGNDDPKTTAKVKTLGIEVAIINGKVMILLTKQL